MAEQEIIVSLNDDDFQLDEEEEVTLSSSPNNRIASIRMQQGLTNDKGNDGLTAFDELIEDSRKSPTSHQHPVSPPKSIVPFQSRNNTVSTKPNVTDANVVGKSRSATSSKSMEGSQTSNSKANISKKDISSNVSVSSNKPSAVGRTALTRQTTLDRASTKTIYDRLIGKTAAESAIVPKAPSNMAMSIGSWFTKETAEEREIRSSLKNYKAKLINELQFIAKAIVKHRRRIIEQIQDFEKQEKQLIAWGLKAALPKFHLQAWFRLARCRLQEETCVELETLLNAKQKKAIVLLQQFEESKNRAGKFSLRATEEFCQSPDVLMISDYTLLSLSERLRQFDMLCQVTTKQFIMLEPHFAWKDHKQRRKMLFKILHSYNALPRMADLTNIETDLTWSSFCKWVAVRMQKLKLIEQDFSDFIEDQREMEGRLFFRWYTSVMLMVNKGKEHKMVSPMPGMLNGNRDESIKEGVDGDQPRLAALKVTPTSIKAFVRYFATDVVGVKYGIPKDCVNANIALTESLFYRRISSYVFRYIDKPHREKDEYWRFHCQKCRYIDPTMYHVPDEYYKPVAIRELEKELSAKHNAKDSDDEEEASKPAVKSKKVVKKDLTDEHHGHGGSGTNLSMITEKLSSMKPSRSSVNLAAASAYAALPPTPMSTLMKKSPSNANLDLAAFIGTSSSSPMPSNMIETHSDATAAGSTAEVPTASSSVVRENKVDGTFPSPSMEDGADGKLMNQQLLTDTPVYGDFFSSNTFLSNAMRPSDDLDTKPHDSGTAAGSQESPIATAKIALLQDSADDDYGYFDEEQVATSESRVITAGDEYPQQQPLLETPQRIPNNPMTSIQSPTASSYEEGLTPIKVQKMMEEMKTPAHHESSSMANSENITPVSIPNESTTSTPQPSFVLSNVGTPIPPPDADTSKPIAKTESNSAMSTTTTIANAKQRSSPSVSSSSVPTMPVQMLICKCSYCLTFSLSLRLQRFHAFHHSSDVNRMIGNPLGVKSNSLFHVGGIDKHVSQDSVTPKSSSSQTNLTSLAAVPSSPMSQLAFLHYGAAYVRASRVMSWISTAMTPREMIFYLTLACKWILRDAIDISGSRSIIGADLMVPLFTLVLIHSEIPNIHMLMYILLHYGDYDDQGDISYNLANLEGSLQFVMSLEVTPEMDELFEQTTIYRSIYESVKANHPYLAQVESQQRLSEQLPPGSRSMKSSSSMLQGISEPILPKLQFNKYNIAQSLPRPADLCNDDIQAMEELGEWLRDQQTMEETIAILQSDGWML